MSKYKPLDAPIARREACAILDRKRFDAAVRAGQIVTLGKMDGHGNIVSPEAGAQTAPLVFSQHEVRSFAKMIADDLLITSKELRATAKDIAKRKPPLTRRQIAHHLGKRSTGILIRGGAIKPYGALTDTQTAAHTYDPADVAKVIDALADEALAESRLLIRGSKVRVPA